MPLNSNQSNVKQYLVTAKAATQVTGVSPWNDTRNYLYFENTGINPCLVRFEDEVQINGGDIELMPGDYREFRNPCPLQRISYYSVLGTTVTVIEGRNI